MILHTCGHHTSRRLVHHIYMQAALLVISADPRGTASAFSCKEAGQGSSFAEKCIHGQISYAMQPALQTCCSYKLPRTASSTPLTGRCSYVLVPLELLSSALEAGKKGYARTSPPCGRLCGQLGYRLTGMGRQNTLH